VKRQALTVGAAKRVEDWWWGRIFTRHHNCAVNHQDAVSGQYGTPVGCGYWGSWGPGAALHPAAPGHSSAPGYNVPALRAEYFQFADLSSACRYFFASSYFFTASKLMKICTSSPTMGIILSMP